MNGPRLMFNPPSRNIEINRRVPSPATSLTMRSGRCIFPDNWYVKIGRYQVTVRHIVRRQMDADHFSRLRFLLPVNLPNQFSPVLLDPRVRTSFQSSQDDTLLSRQLANGSVLEQSNYQITQLSIIEGIQCRIC